MRSSGRKVGRLKWYIEEVKLEKEGREKKNSARNGIINEGMEAALRRRGK